MRVRGSAATSSAAWWAPTARSRLAHLVRGSVRGKGRGRIWATARALVCARSRAWVRARLADHWSHSESEI